MLGAIIGDIIGSPFEGFPYKKKDFNLFDISSRFTDDTVLTLATAEWYNSSKLESIQDLYHKYGNMYPDCGFGGRFKQWLKEDDKLPYNSWGNGSAMRVSPVAWACDTIEEVMEDAKITAEVTHNDPEGIKGAQAVAVAIFLAKFGASKTEIKNVMEWDFDYDLSRKLDDIRPNYKFDVSCQGSVPESIICFLESVSFEDAIRNAVSLGGDADTMASIAGAIAEAYYGGIPVYIVNESFSLLDKNLKAIWEKFNDQYVIRF